MDLDHLEEKTRNCNNCHLRKTCRGVVFGEGNPLSPLMLVGEAPGQNEDEQGRPFVGKAGQLLDKILLAAGLPRESVYITNIVKCRPPGNRTPTLAEMQTCLPWLRQQFTLIRPRFIVLLGAAATQGILGQDFTIGKCHGQWFIRKDVQIMPTYHPAAVLRNPNLKKLVWEDFKKVSSAVKEYMQGNLG